MTYRKSILERMIYLMQLNFAMPVLDYIRVRARKMDQSLSMHFVKRVLEMVSGPYSKKFIEGMGQMIQEIVEVIKKTDTEPIVRAWIGKLLGSIVPFGYVSWLCFDKHLSLCLFVCLFVYCSLRSLGVYCFCSCCCERVWSGPIVDSSSFSCVLICAILRQGAYGSPGILTKSLSSPSFFSSLSSLFPFCTNVLWGFVHVLFRFWLGPYFSLIVPTFCLFALFSLYHTTDEVVLQPVDVEMQSSPTSASSLTHETSTSAAAAAANDSGLSTIQEIKKRLEEHRR